ncbi:Pleckstrin -like proteiny domain-containing family G member 3 [Takifugu flavidus]|uniref:Pleckstrin-like proteiny domain-containing family G member 3 n=1 Tax=Takifugu flavidus TaxID=433684 RepID=A0A5C6NMW3_9TELE|nr:Pleckstrin -like proteiny domain-containing family G member 3 [Takifugu flavidus]
MPGPGFSNRTEVTLQNSSVLMTFVLQDLLVGVNNPNKQLPEDASNGTEASSEQATTDVLLLQKSEQEEEEAAEEEPPSQPESLDGTHHSESPRSFEDQTSDRDSESAGTPSSAPESNPPVLSSEESSEDEEGMTDGGEAGGRTPSILPSSVLDRAGAIAQHFTNSVRRASLAQDEVRFLGCASPRLPGRPNTLRTEPAEGASGVTTEAPEAMVTDLTSPSSREDGVFDGNRDSRRRRDSTLSTQDQLLLSKIKSYYDNAESQSPTFCLQRRESLTYIPAGLVRSSITRINSIPKADSMETTCSVTNSGPSSSLATESQDLLDSSQSLDTLSFELKGIEDSRKSQRSPFQHSQDSPSEEEEFIPSSQMIRIWQNMEQEMTLTQKEKKISTLQEAPQNSRASHKVSDSIKVQTKDSHPKSQELQTEKVFNRETLVLRPPIHQVSQAKPETGGGSTCEDDMEQANSKVLHLARQYSQKIKTAKPVVRQRSQGLLLCKNRLACVVEELEKTEISEKPKLDLNNSAVPPPLSHPAKVRSASSSLLCKEKMISRDRAQSCTSVNHSSSSSNEAFNWPDVQQLRSKYCNRSNSQKHVVSPANFTPDHVSRRRHSSCSSCLLPEGDALKVPSFKSGDTWETKAGESRRRLQRAGSLDLRLRNTGTTEAATQQEELTDLSRGGYFVAAKAPLPNDPEHCVIVMEKVLQPVEKSTEAEDEDNYIQIRSPTSKEKISIMAVIDRCRVYQDSDQYREGEEVKVRTEVARVPGDEESQEPKTKQKENGTHNVVKNLREKFQNMS